MTDDSHLLKELYGSDAPVSAADERPDDEPYFIDTDCPECDEPLVLYDSLTDEQLRSSQALVDPEFQAGGGPFYDEWVCPDCLDGVHLDWPDEKLNTVESIVDGVDPEDAIPLGDVLKDP
jgi:hypothetical protein